jgi:putative hemolysin
MVPNFARDASTAWLAGWETHVHAPFSRLKRKRAEAGFPVPPGFQGRALIPPGAVPIKFKPRLKKPLPAPGLDPSLGRIGNLEVRLATCVSEIRRAQRLRYRVFFEEMQAVATGLSLLSRRDIDAYDAVCDHLLVIDHAATDETPFRRPRPKVVGTYRLLRQDTADRHFGFYTAGEYDITPLLAAHPGKRFLELGRSCVLKPYRTKRTVELLWAGIWSYVQHHRIDAMLGCASLEGTDPERLALPLSFLHHHARAPEGWGARALPERYVAMDRLSREVVDPKAALQSLPPLIKGYLRVGATFGDGAVVDHQFGTTDVFVVLPVSAIAARYRDHFGAAADRKAA